LVELLIPEVGVGLLAGQWGTWKTFVAIDLAVAIMTGGVFIKFPVMRKGAVLFLALEGEAEVPVRIEAALKARGYAGKAPFAWINECPRLLDKDAAENLTAMIRQAGETLKENFGADVAMIIVDTVGRGAGYTKQGDENDSVPAKIIATVFERAARETGAFFLGVDHFGKDPTTGTRGSSAKEADVDVVLALLGDKAQSGAVTGSRLCARKRRSGQNGEEFPFRTEVVDMGCDPNGTPVSTLVVDWTDVPEEVARPEAKDKWDKKSMRHLQRTLMAMLAEHGEDTQPGPPDGPSIRAVNVETVRAEFYATYVVDGTDEQKAAARQKAFKRALNEAQAAGLVGAREIGGQQLMWLSVPDLGGANV
jgi:hypothetical protein